MLEWVRENAELCIKSGELVRLKKGQGGLKEGAKFILIAAFIAGLIQAILQLLLLGTLGAVYGGVGQALLGGSVYAAFLIVGIPIVSLLAAFILQGIIYVVARLLGGKGTFADQFYLMAIPTSIATLVGVLQLIPCLGSLVLMVFLLYLLFVQIVVVRDLHQITAVRAVVAALVVPLLLFILVMFVLPLLLYLGVFNIGPSSAPAGGAISSGGGLFGMPERVPDQCRFKVGLLCTSAKISASEGISLKIQNTLGSKVSVCRIRCSGAQTDAGAIISQAVPGCEGGGLDTLYSGMAGTITDSSPDALGCLKDENDVSGPYYNAAGNRVRGKIYIWYSEQGEGTAGNARLTVGDLQTTVMP